MSNLFELTAADAANLIKAREVSVVEVVTSCLERISSRDDAIKAWQMVDYEGALTAAKYADSITSNRGPLHGVPVGLKDIIDTAQIKTTYGSKAFADHWPTQNAKCVDLLKRSGAIVIGKTVTTEFAFFAPGPTVNPHHFAHTPGGSSSGSAAAVADFHVPITLGTQTAGSIIRPASFNGIFGYKPSYNRYDNSGVHPLSPSLDTLGSFARGVTDLRLVDTALCDSAMPLTEMKKPVSVVVIKTPYWRQSEIEMQNAFENFVASLDSDGIQIKFPEAHCVAELEQSIIEISACQLLLMAIEAQSILTPIAEKYAALLRPQTLELIEQGLSAPQGAQDRIVAAQHSAEKILAALFELGEIILTPSALGAAPAGIDSTGDPVFNRPWTFARTPCVNIPIACNAEGLPLGIQSVGKINYDDDLLARSAYLASITNYPISPP